MVLGTTQNNFRVFLSAAMKQLNELGEASFSFFYIFECGACFGSLKSSNMAKIMKTKVRFFSCSNCCTQPKFLRFIPGFPRTRNSDTWFRYLESLNPIFRVLGTIIRGNTGMVTLDFIFETYLILMGHFLERVYVSLPPPPYSTFFSLPLK